MSATYPTRERIGEVLNSLISNAIKYSPDGGDITVYIKTTADGAEVSVHDNGIGIPEEEKANLFERFSRIKSKKQTPSPVWGLGYTSPRLSFINIREKSGLKANNMKVLHFIFFCLTTCRGMEYSMFNDQYSTDNSTHPLTLSPSHPLKFRA